MNRNRFTFLFLLLFALCQPANSQENSKAAAEQETEEEDGGKFLVLPIFITEPAIGEGLGAGLVYFHANRDPDQPRITTPQTLNRADRRQKPPPTATGAFAFYTNDDTTGVGIGHSRTFKDDTYRLMAAVADARINATYYVSDNPFSFTLEGELLFAKLKRRLGNSYMFAGISTSYVNADTIFRPNPDAPAGPGIADFSFTDVGLAANLIYDSRDDSMMPTTGQLAELALWRYDDAFGGDFDYTSTTLKWNYFHAFAKRFVLGLRFEVSAASGDVPFYAEPFVKLRGIPALRYQGEVAGVTEIEVRYQFARRWAVLAFAGTGFTNERTMANETEDDINAYGVGLRYLALLEQNVWVGLDVAQGPENKAFYIQMTHPW